MPRLQQTDNLLTETLKLINLYRKERGLPTLDVMPKGKLVGYNSCPIKKAMEAIAVCHNMIEFSSEEEAKTASKVLGMLIRFGLDFLGTATTATLLPKTIQTFISKFDSRHYPELIEIVERKRK